MRKAVGSGQWAVGSEASIGGKALACDCRSSIANALPAVDTPLAINNSGVILIALLWIFVALSVIALSFSKESFVEVAAARNAQSLENAYFAARAGINATIFQLYQKRLSSQSSTQTGTTTTTTTTTSTTATTDAVDNLDLGIATGEYGGASYQVKFQDESGKANVNTITEQQLRTLLQVLQIPDGDLEIIADSILDWRDSDTTMRTNGAEDTYYQSLTPSYKAKNANLDAIEELLLVRGITTDYFYGHAERLEDGSVAYVYGLSRYLTAYSSSQQINVNFAELPVLESIPGMTADTALAIYERRKVQPFKNMNELTSGSFSVGNAAQYLTTGSTYYYTMTATGQALNSKARRIIRAVVSLNASQGKQYQTLYWNENVPDYYDEEGDTQ